jgi:hypothetical protein
MKSKSNLKKLFKGKETYKEELKEGRAIKSGKITPEQYAKGEEMEKSKPKGYKAGGAIRMANGGLNPRMSRGFGPGIAAGMGRGSGSVPGAMMAKGGGVEAKAKNPAKMVKMAKGGGVESKGKTRGKFV